MKLILSFMFMGASFVFAANPQVQAHTLDRSIFADAVLRPLGDARITGTVEFKNQGKNAAVLLSVANAAPGAEYTVELIESKKCTAAESSGNVPDLEANKRRLLGKVKTEENGIGTSTFTLNKRDVPEGKFENILQDSVFVSQVAPGLEAVPYLACGVIQGTGQGKLSPDKANPPS